MPDYIKKPMFRTAIEANDEINRLEFILDLRRRNGIERALEKNVINEKLINSAEWFLEFLTMHNIGSTELNPRLRDSYPIVKQAIAAYNANGELTQEDLKNIRRVMMPGYEMWEYLKQKATAIDKVVNLLFQPNE